MGAEGWGRWEQRVGEGGSRGLGKVEAEGWGRWKQRVGQDGCTWIAHPTLLE